MMTTIKTTFLAAAVTCLMTTSVLAIDEKPAIDKKPATDEKVVVDEKATADEVYAAKIPAVRSNCYHTPWFSDCNTAQGYAVRGMNCRGDNCDDKQLYCCADGLPDLDPGNRIDSPYFSEENCGSYEDVTRVLTGLACTGGDCDNISMTMYGFRTDLKIDQYWRQDWFSEERGYDRCQRNNIEMGFVVGLACRGGRCDNLKLSCITYKE